MCNIIRSSSKGADMEAAPDAALKVKLKIVLLVFVLLGGCAGFHSETLSPSRTAADFASRTLDSVKFRRYAERNIGRGIVPWPPKLWDFKMLGIAAFYYHPDMDVARARWGVAKAGVITAGGRPNPGISLLGQHHSATAGGISPWTFGVLLDIPAETAGKRGYRIRRAGYLSEAARLNMAETTWRVWSRLRRGLLDLYAAAGRERLLGNALTMRQETLKLFEARAAAGESSRLDVTLARLDLDKTLLLLSGAQERKSEARAALAGAIGLPAAALEGIAISFDLFKNAPEAVSLAEARRQALINRPDVAAALSEYEAEQAALQLEIAKQYPDIHLGPGYEWDQGDNKWSLGFSVELPVFNRNQGPIEEAKARRKESAARFVALQTRVAGEIDRAQAAYSEALKKLRIADSLVSAERDHVQAIQGRFDSGETDRLALEEVQTAFSSAELSRFDALVSAQENLGMLEDAVHQQLSSEEK